MKYLILLLLLVSTISYGQDNTKAVQLKKYINIDGVVPANFIQGLTIDNVSGLRKALSNVTSTTSTGNSGIDPSNYIALVNQVQGINTRTTSLSVSVGLTTANVASLFSMVNATNNAVASINNTIANIATSVSSATSVASQALSNVNSQQIITNGLSNQITNNTAAISNLNLRFNNLPTTIIDTTVFLRKNIYNYDKQQQGNLIATKLAISDYLTGRTTDQNNASNATNLVTGTLASERLPIITSNGTYGGSGLVVTSITRDVYGRVTGVGTGTVTAGSSNTLVVDQTVNSGSTNPVSGQGVKAYADYNINLNRQASDTSYVRVQIKGVVNGVQDNTQQVLNALLSDDEVKLKKGTYIVSRIVIPPYKNIIIPKGVIIKGRQLTTSELSGLNHYGVIELSTGCTLSGEGIIDGNKSQRSSAYSHGVYFIYKDSVKVKDITIQNTGGSCIRFQNCNRTSITNTKDYNPNDKGIECINSNYFIIAENEVNNALHGIQFWGDTTSKVFSQYGTISNNVVTNIAGGGIWGHKGRFISVVGNVVLQTGDVGVDFETCEDCNATANSVTNCTNQALGVYFGSKRIAFNNNTVVQDATYGNAFKAYYQPTSLGGPCEDISITGGSYLVKNPAQAIFFTEDKATRRLSITNVQSATTVGNNAITIQNGDRYFIANNRMYVGGPFGVDATGGSYGTIQNNEFIYTGSDNGATGIRLSWTSAQYPAQHNLVRANNVGTFPQGINNNIGSDVSGYSFISDNITAKVTTPASPYAYTVVERNRNLAFTYIDGTAASGAGTTFNGGTVNNDIQFANPGIGPIIYSNDGTKKYRIRVDNNQLIQLELVP